MLKINKSKKADKFLKGLQKKQEYQIARKLSQLKLNPHPQDAKKILNSPFLRADSGEYRIIYTVNNAEKTLDIFLIGKRNDDEVYRDLKNILS
jgi:mRNA interferase RelE/StbE